MPTSGKSIISLLCPDIKDGVRENPWMISFDTDGVSESLNPITS